MIPVILVLLLGGFFAHYFRKLTAMAALTGMVIAFLIFLAAGWKGILMMAAFFLLGTMASSHKRGWKERAGIAEADKGRRNASQVLANSGVAGALAILMIIEPDWAPILAPGIAGCFAAATSDTLSSELGSVYGRYFFNIASFRKDQRGENGVISFEGTVIGIMGSALIAAIYIWEGWNPAFFSILLAGVFGNITDSILGALAERKGLMRNDTVNAWCTVVGAVGGVLGMELIINN